MNFIEKIDRLCACNGLSERAFASKIQISPSAISRWRSRNAKPRPAVVKRIADLFKVSVDDLIDDLRELPPSSLEGVTASLKQAAEIAKRIHPSNQEAAQALFEHEADKGTWLGRRNALANFLRTEAKKMRQTASDFDSRADDLDPPGR